MGACKLPGGSGSGPGHAFDPLEQYNGILDAKDDANKLEWQL
jgi:hypothetical protein